jgi:hypothetical protein
MKEQVRCERQKDRFFSSLKVKKASHVVEYVYDQDGVICKRSYGKYRLLVPQSLVESIVATNHDRIYAAHPGPKRTLDTIAPRYWWPNMN